MHVMQTEALQHHLCSSVMCQCNGESLELLESGLNVPERIPHELEVFSEDTPRVALLSVLEIV